MLTREEKVEFIKNLGYTDYQARTIYDKMNCSLMDTEEELEEAANDWYNTEKDLERCGVN